MLVTNRSGSLDDALAEQVERAACDEDVSFSAWLNAAAEQQLFSRRGRQGIQDWEYDACALMPQERAAGEVLLDRLLGDSVQGAV